MRFPATAAKRAKNSVPLLGLYHKKKNLLFYSQNKNCRLSLQFFHRCSPVSASPSPGRPRRRGAASTGGSSSSRSRAHRTARSS